MESNSLAKRQTSMHLQSSKRFSVLLTLSLGVGEAPKRLSMPLWMTLLEVDTDLDLLFWLARERLDRLYHRNYPGY